MKMQLLENVTHIWQPHAVLIAFYATFVFTSKLKQDGAHLFNDNLLTPNVPINLAGPDKGI